MRHVFRKRAAFTRPNLGTAIRMSITFAVSTYSGGLPRTVSIRTRPSLRSFFSFARRTRTSFARLSASMRWSSERTGAWVAVFDGDIEAGAPILPNCRGRSSRRFHGEFTKALGRAAVVQLDNGELVADAPRRAGIAEQHGAERDVARSARDEIDDVLRVRDPAHSDDRKLGRRRARVDRSESDRLQRRSGEAARAAREHRSQRARVDGEPAQRVDQRETVRAGVFDRT